VHQAVGGGGGDGGGGGVGGGVDHDALRRAVHARTAFFTQHADDARSTLNMKEARQILEGDLKLSRGGLDGRKDRKLIAQLVDRMTGRGGGGGGGGSGPLGTTLDTMPAPIAQFQHEGAPPAVLVSGEAQGKGVHENKHSTIVQSTSRVRAHV